MSTVSHLFTKLSRWSFRTELINQKSKSSFGIEIKRRFRGFSQNLPLVNARFDKELTVLFSYSETLLWK